MQAVVDKIIAELKALIEIKKMNEALIKQGDDDFSWNDYNERKNIVIDTIMFLET